MMVAVEVVTKRMGTRRNKALPMTRALKIKAAPTERTRVEMANIAKSPTGMEENVNWVARKD